MGFVLESPIRATGKPDLQAGRKFIIGHESKQENLFTQYR
ncbi:hypothetical protein SAMN05444359_12067 [Neolewinella agarilytica]|uniref:Uncharacterized protein n=1 Tax=Neolewinella agarilytica TaxID=478744 RepID=A0A1H9KE64_9BACT|nr:hypothetical protein SAMN05444359_12067 [Neolewinella agarilytica]